MSRAERTVLVLAPRFAPVNAPDAERVRTSAVHFDRFGWRAVILCVDPAHSTMAQDPALRAALPDGLEIHTARCVPRAIARRVGVSDPGLLAAPWLYARGSHLIGTRGVDLIYGSTTAFSALPLGRLWRRRHGTPFVVDMHDPWVDESATAPRPGLKHGIMRALHRRFEPFTMDAVDGLVAVSTSYLETLASRYPRLRTVPQRVLPFAASPDDFAHARAPATRNPCFTPGDGRVHGVYAGHVQPAMLPALEALFDALHRGLEDRPDHYGRVALHFLGTRYHDHDGPSAVRAAAMRAGVASQVFEQPRRRPLFEALRAMSDADFVLVLGPATAAYTPSKAAQCFLSGRPVLGLCHVDSPVHAMAAALGCDTFAAFGDAGPRVETVLRAWDRVLVGPQVRTCEEALRPYLAEAGAGAQCALFDEVLAHTSAAGDGS